MSSSGPGPAPTLGARIPPQVPNEGAPAPNDIDARLKFQIPALGMGGVLRNVVATFYGLYCVPCVPLWFVLGFILWPLGLAHAIAHWVVKIFLEIWTIVFRIKLVVEGVEHVDPKQTYVIAANHRSWLDPVAMVVTLKLDQGNLRGRNLYFVIKQSLLFIPGFGLHMWWAGYIAVKRSARGRREGGKKDSDKKDSHKKDSHKKDSHKKDSANKTGAGNSARVDAAVKSLKIGKTILIFPEGTRAPDHCFRRFRGGAAEMAIQAGVPILPVCFSGSGALYPKGKIYMRAGTVRVQILPPIEPQGHTRESLTQASYDVISENYRLQWNSPPVGEDAELLAVVAPEHSRARKTELRPGNKLG